MTELGQKNPPTNPKKKSLMPSTPLRRALRGHGHALDAIVQIGKDGTSGPVRKQLQQALFDHELVKVKIGSECPQSRFEVAEILCEDPGVQIVQILGKMVLVYKRHPRKPRYEGARARQAELADEPTKTQRRAAAAKRPAAKRGGLVKGRSRATKAARGQR